MENKYYTPDIEDLHLGYECEQLIILLGEFDKDIPNEQWVKLDVTKVDININISKFRTEFLTKEQIEKEGWRFDRFIDDALFIKNMYIFRKDSDKEYTTWSLKYIPGEIPYIIIDSEIIVKNQENPIISCYFSGNCPSINEFRKIMKLLNIK